MAFDRITAKQREGKGVTDLPDTPNMTATDLQARFDSLANLALDTINLLMDALEAKTAASSIGTASGTLQSWMSSCESAVTRNTSGISELSNKFTNLSSTYYSTDKVPATLLDLKGRMTTAESDLKVMTTNLEKKYDSSSIIACSSAITIEMIDADDWIDVTDKLDSVATNYQSGTTLANYTVTEKSSFSADDQIGIRVLDNRGNVIGCNIITVGKIGAALEVANCTLSFNSYFQEEETCTVQVYLSNSAGVSISYDITRLKER